MNDDLSHGTGLTGHYDQSAVVQKVVSLPFLVRCHSVLPERLQHVEMVVNTTHALDMLVHVVCILSCPTCRGSLPCSCILVLRTNSKSTNMTRKCILVNRIPVVCSCAKQTGCLQYVACWTEDRKLSFIQNWRIVSDAEFTCCWHVTLARHMYIIQFLQRQAPMNAVDQCSTLLLALFLPG